MQSLGGLRLVWRPPTRDGPSEIGTLGRTPRPHVVLWNGSLRVWIDQDLCTGDGICTDHSPEVFVMLEDGIAYVKEGDEVLNDPGGSRSLAHVPDRCVDAVLLSAQVCPGECIFVEPDEDEA